MNKVMDGMLGLAVGDALGVPVEFNKREHLKGSPVEGMRGYGTHSQPPGTWSDDTSLALCLMDSLTEGLDYHDIMKKSLEWYHKGAYTPYGEVFDIGNTTRKALDSFTKGTPPLDCGGISERDNGNGSLMRILPLVFYIEANYGVEFKEQDDIFNIIHNVSSLTHAHKRSQVACGIYISIASNLLTSQNLESAVSSGVYKAKQYYDRNADYAEEIIHFKRMMDKNFADLPEDSIKSSGYVVATLEAAVWCLLNTSSYKECVLKAVNLGEDTDTTGAVAGGLAGLYYGYEDIPGEWLDSLAQRDYIERLCTSHYVSLSQNGVKKLCEYIPFFETATSENVCRWEGGEKTGKDEYHISFPVYDSTLSNFIRDFYSTNLIYYNYLNLIEQRELNNTSEMIEAIATADLELLKALLTGFVRQERFGDGLWEFAIEQKIYLKVLKRFNELFEGLMDS